ncbi:uncharacterized protein [Pyxicephalus adspersus]|uniref:uncharacterized protein n=1 Tax=Pyxicephalus adspersus TaxID=30357 RepID=UPI003B5ACD42
MSQDNPQPKKGPKGIQDRSFPREKKSRYSNIGLHTEERNRQKNSSKHGKNVIVEGHNNSPICLRPAATVAKMEGTDNFPDPYLNTRKLIPIVDTCRIETTLAQMGENKMANTSKKVAAGHKNIKRRAHEDNEISDFERELMNEKHHRKKKPLDPRHRLRNAKFTAHENLILVENLIPMFHKLAGNNLATTDPAWKHAAWLKITAAVNSLGVYPRHHEHVKKRFHDIKFALRKKMSDEEQSRRSGVSVPGKKIIYHDYEELLKPYIYKESFIGIDGGYNSSKHVKEQPGTLLLYSENSSESGLSVTAQGLDLDTEDEEEITTNMDAPITFYRQHTSHPIGNSSAAEPFIHCANSIAPESTGVADSDVTDAAVVPPAPSLHRSTVYHTRNMDHQQYVFDVPQSERLQDKQKSHRKCLMNRLDVLNNHLAKFNALYEQQIATTQIYRQQQLNFMCKQNELLTEQLSKLDSITTLLGERNNSSNI